MIGRCCRNTCNIITGTVAVDGTNLLITPSTALTLDNEEKLSIVITNAIPAGGMILPVTITINGADVPVYDKFGNILYGTALRTNTVIRAYYGVNGSGATAHLIAVNQPFTCCN